MTANWFLRAIGAPSLEPDKYRELNLRCPMCEQWFNEMDENLFGIGSDGTRWHGRCFARRIVELGIPPMEETP